MSILDKMNSSELEALAANLHAQIDRSPKSEMPKVELQDVKSWIASHMKEACFEPSFFLNLV